MATIIIALAGIQTETYEATRVRVNREVSKIFNKNGYSTIITGVPVKKNDLWSFQNDQNYKNKLMRVIWKNIQSFGKHEKVGIFIAHASYENVKYDIYKRTFCPFALTVDFPAVPIHNSRSIFVNKIANQFTVDIKNKFLKLLPKIGFLKHQLIARRNSAACLLPFSNFKSPEFTHFIHALFDAISFPGDPASSIENLIEEYEKKFPRQRTNGAGKKLNYVDDRNLIFQAPGNALHGYPQHTFEDAHNYQCLLNAVSRFGIGYERSFHYDCTYSGQSVTGDFNNCHNELTSYAGNQHTHINISPNDFIR